MKPLFIFLNALCLCFVFVTGVEAQKTKRTKRSQKQPSTIQPTQSTNKTPTNTEQPPKTTKVPQPPNELSLDAAALSMNVGDSWSYVISSADKLSDGKIFTVNLKEKKSAELVFSVQMGDSPARTVSVQAGEVSPFAQPGSPKDASAAWFMPSLSETGDFTVKRIENYPPSIKQGERRTFTSSHTEYAIQYGQPVPARTVILYVIYGYGPFYCVVPAGTFECVELTKHVAGLVDSQAWLGPKIAAAVQARVRRPKSSLISFRLVSYKPSTQSEATVNKEFVSTLATTEREKAIEWIKANVKFGDGSDVIEDILFSFDSGIGLFPSAVVQIALGSDLTRSGKGYILKSIKGKFITREMTVEESEKSGKMDIQRSVIQ